MALIDINWNPSRRELRLFGGLWFPLFLAAVGGWAIVRGGSPLAGGAALGAAAIVCAIGWLAPSILKPVFIALTLVTFPIGWVVSIVLLGAIYYGIITPLGWGLRLFGHDPMQRHFDRAATTYWVPHRQRPGADHYFRQF